MAENNFVKVLIPTYFPSIGVRYINAILKYDEWLI